MGAIAGFVGKAILGAAIGRGTTWLMDGLGLNPFEDPTQVRLDELSAQVHALGLVVQETQVRVDRLTSDLLQAELNRQLRDLRGRVNQIQSLYQTVYIPIMDRAQDLTDVIRRGDDPTAAQQRLEQARARFFLVYDSNLAIYGPLGRDIHEFLVPGATTSVLRAKGQVLLDRNRYLTSAHSATLRQLYEVMADQQALAVWMKAERYVALDRRVYNRTIADYRQWRAVELQHLAPLIPKNVVIDVGRPGITTNNRLMWMPGGQGLDWMANAPNNNAPTVARTLTGMNNDRVVGAGLQGWRLPTRNQLTLFYEGTSFRPGTDDFLAFLRGINPGGSLWQQIAGQAGEAWQWIASSDTQREVVACRFSGFRERPPVVHNLNFDSNWALGTASGGSRWHVRPQLNSPPRDTPMERCRAHANQQLHNPMLRAGVLAARNTGIMTQDYMAQGSAMDRLNSSVSTNLGQECCAGCSYKESCCCPPRQTVTYIVTKKVATATTTVTRKAKREAIKEEVAIQHLCPDCKAGKTNVVGVCCLKKAAIRVTTTKFVGKTVKTVTV
jgi:hypothetical protein